MDLEALMSSEESSDYELPTPDAEVYESDAEVYEPEADEDDASGVPAGHDVEDYEEYEVDDSPSWES